VAGKSFATQLLGRVTHGSGVVSMLGIDVNATGGGDAITITGSSPTTQLYLSDCVAYAYGTDNAAELDVTTDGSSGILFDNVNFRVLGGAGVPINLLRGTVQGRSGTFWPVAQTTPALAITGGGTSSTRGRAWLRDCDVFGKCTVTGNGELQLLGGQVRSGTGAAVEDTSTGPVLMVNVALQSSLAAGDVVTSDGNLAYSQIVFSTPFQTMAALATRLPGSDALASEVFNALMTNQADFTVPTGAAPVLAKFATVQQNTAPVVVFDPQANGSVIVRRAGDLHVDVNLQAEGPLTGIEVQILVNGVPIAAPRAWSVAGATVHLAASRTWRVAANDVIAIALVPDEITTMAAVPNVRDSVSLRWTGVR
jgi:hypothetical protein